MSRARIDGLSLTALVCAVALALPPGFMLPAAGIAASAQSATAPRPAPAAQTAPAMPEHDGGWPRTYPVAGGGSATLYQPQIESWPNQSHMTVWAAVAYQRPDVKDPAFGTVKIEADTKVSPTERLVSFSDFAITEFNFPTLSREQSQALLAGLRTGIPADDRVIALDRVLAAIDKSNIRPNDAAGIKADPPHVFFSTRPAILVNLDGNPVWSAIQGLDPEYAVNTNWDLFRTSSKVLYLRNNNTWLTAPDINGKWSPAGPLPASFAKLPANDNWKETKANIPGVAVTAGGMPTVFVSTSPAELLLLRGAPVYQPVTGTSLLWVSNTESDLFRQGKAGLFYYLVSGRWFSAPSLEGPWTFATPNLPADFKQIPPDHPRSRVLASVPGTDQAIEAVLLAQMPHTARVNIAELKPPDVVYQGEPQFEPISGTTLLRAVNTDNDVIKVGDRYYMCYQAVWFTSPSATGPWQVATAVPQEIHRIPPSSPAYHVTYVTAMTAIRLTTGSTLRTRQVISGWRSRGAPRCGAPAGTTRPTWHMADCIPRTSATREHTARAPGTTPGPAGTVAAMRRMGRSAVPVRARCTTRARAPTRAAQRRTGRTAAVRLHKHSTPVREPMRPPDRVETSTATGDRAMCSVATTGRAPRIEPTI